MLLRKIGEVTDKAEEAMYNARLKQVRRMICNLKISSIQE